MPSRLPSLATALLGTAVLLASFAVPAQAAPARPVAAPAAASPQRHLAAQAPDLPSSAAGAAQGTTPSTVTVAAAPPVVGGAWTSLGPAPISGGLSTGMSGRTLGLATTGTTVDANHPVFAGTAGGGIWRSTDGSTWSVAGNSDSLPSLAIGALAVDPATLGAAATLRVLAGSGEPANAADAKAGAGIYRSIDGGASWTVQGASTLPAGGYTISSVLFDPASAYAFAGVVRKGSGARPNTGVAVSGDRGATWTVPANALKGHDVTDLSIDSVGNLFAAVGDGTSADGVYYSTDHGTSFSLLKSDAALNQLWWKVALAPSTAGLARASQVVYALEASKSTGAGGNGSIINVFRSADGGSSWSSVTNGLDVADQTAGVGQAWYDLYLAVDPTNASTVYAATTDVYKTTNAGALWTNLTKVYIGPPAANAHPDQHAIAFLDGSNVFLGNDGGVMRTANGGGTFTTANTGLATLQFYGGAVAPNNTLAIGGLQDNGNVVTTDGGAHWADNTGGDGMYVAIDPASTNLIYAEYAVGLLELSTNGGTTFSGPFDPSAGTDGTVAFIAPLALDTLPATHVLYSGRHRLWSSTNPCAGGCSAANFSSAYISTDGTSGLDLMHPTAYLKWVSPAGNAIYAVDVYGNTYTSADKVHWSKVNGTDPSACGLPFYCRVFPNLVTSVTVDPTATATAYQTVDGIIGSAGSHVFKTSNSGASWFDISTTLPDVPFRTLAVSPANHNTIFAGSDAGVFASGDGGATWSTLGSGLPNVVVDNLVVQGSFLYAFTHGRSAWRIPIGGGNKFVISAVATQVAGTPFSVTVTAADVNGTAIPGYVGTVHFATGDPTTPTVPGDYTFTTGGGADNGVHTFNGGFTLKKGPSQTITASEVANGGAQALSSAIATVTVNPGATSTLVVAAPAAAVTQTPFSFTVTAKDGFGNTATGYGGTVHFTVTGSAASVPGNSALTSGAGSFNATPTVSGSFTITASDTVAAGINGVSGTITVTDGVFSQMTTTNASYHLDQASDGATWVEVDAALRNSFTIGAGQAAVVGGNMDLWTAAAGYNQDVGLFTGTDCAIGHLIGWKESGGFAGTFSPNAAFVQSVLTTSGSYTVTLCWKANKPAPGGTLFGGAGTSDTYFSPTSIGVKVMSSANLRSSAAGNSYHLDWSQPDRSSTWYEVDSALRVSYLAPSNGNLLLGGNMDLWTAAAGFNQDVGIFLGTDCAVGHLVAWKESGGFAGTFSPNAAFVQGTFAATSGTSYTFTLCWKANKPAPAGTLFGGAGTSDTYFSPTRLTVEFVPSASGFSGSSQQQSYHLDWSQPDRASTWYEVDPLLRTSVTAAGGQSVILGSNMDLWTAATGNNQDFGIFLGTDCTVGHMLAWKESGGFAGTFSPNAAFVQARYTPAGPGTYTFTLCWKVNKPAPPGTVFGGAGTSDTYFSPTSLTAEATT